MSGTEITSVVFAKWIVLSFWSIVGGITHSLIQIRKGNVTTFLDGASLSFISSFAGAMWGMLAIKFYGTDITVVAFAGGMGGFLSVEGLVMLVNAFKRKYLK